VDWLFGRYPEPWRAILRISFVLFLVIFSAYFWWDGHDTLITVVTLAIIAFQFIVTRSLRGREGRLRAKS
jgi:hypothetical protein